MIGNIWAPFGGGGGQLYRRAGPCLVRCDSFSVRGGDNAVFSELSRSSIKQNQVKNNGMFEGFDRGANSVKQIRVEYLSHIIYQNIRLITDKDLSGSGERESM